MRKVAVLGATIALALLAFAPAVRGTIHPIVESIDCANDAAFAHHPLDDVANPPGQTPGATPGEGQNVFAALSHANANAFSDFKFNGTCGNAPTP
jgi:hypothetical protein